MRTIFVYNPASGNALLKRELRTLTDRAGIAIDIWLPISNQFTKQLTKLVEGHVRVFAYGGDGTISTVASSLVGTSAELVPLPGGTLNHFSKDLGITQSLSEALEGVRTWQLHNIDVASVNGYYFINNSSVGVYARSLETRDQLSGKVAKWPAAVWATIKELIQFRTYKVRINSSWHRTPLLFVGNNHYSLSSGELGIRKKLTAGTISLYIAKASSRWAMFRIGLGILAGKRADLIEQKNTKIIVEFERKNVIVSMDGEKKRLATPLTYQIHPGTLRVLIPKK